MFTLGARALVPEYFVLAHGHRDRILAWILDTRVYSHKCPVRIALGHHARDPSVNIALQRFDYIQEI